MSTEPHARASILGPPAAVVARVVGIVCIASGFVVGIEGLGSPETGWLRTALALIVTGLVAQVVALYVRVRYRRRSGEAEPAEEGPSDEDGAGESGRRSEKD